ncbi:hypothetical protein O1611_g58 [Lasiodiplodia mahajangana]|uniref:Uncharacterized protein n=1 Tax=Lasiodiplodia mahajangana TaxID=1108764 RepID=A0ACC2K1A8_9PEZI|nr:hypothetical protein O1611_g58 [Lasiodiplodia mahajangana]
MRLIKVDTRRLEEFFDSSIPKYAILSHTWGVREVTLQEFEKYPSKACTDLDGYHKIDKACTLAEAEGLQYVWVDSCCIDKTSSAELSEAINSMFRCGKQRYNSLLQSTLQDITGIDLSAWPQAGLAEILSWASKRQTTRKEDMAYCLIGLLNINIPLLYGEGEAAFPRLLGEVAQVTNDQSIFAAGYNLPWSLSIGRRAASWSIFASQAKEYQGCPHVSISARVTFPFRGVDYNNPERLAWLNRRPVDAELRHFVRTGAGLQMRLPIVEIDPITGTYLGLLNCYHKEPHYQLSLVLQGADLANDNHSQHIELSMNPTWLGFKKGHDIFRVAPGHCPISVPPLFQGLATPRTIYIQSNWPLEQDRLQLSFPDMADAGFSLGSIYPPSSIRSDSNSEFVIYKKSIIQSLQLFVVFLHPKLRGSLVLGVFEDFTGEHYRLAWSPARSCVELLLVKNGRTLRPDGFNKPDWIDSDASATEPWRTWSPSVYLQGLCRKLDWKESLELIPRVDDAQKGLIKASGQRNYAWNSHVSINLL